MTAKEVQDALVVLRDKLRTDTALAKLLRVTVTYIPKLLSQPPDTLHPHTETAIRIAAAIHRALREVLEAFGDSDIADALEEHYEPRHKPGDAAPLPRLKPEDYQLVEALNTLRCIARGGSGARSRSLCSAGSRTAC